MSEKIVQLNQEVIKRQIKVLGRCSIEEFKTSQLLIPFLPVKKQCNNTSRALHEGLNKHQAIKRPDDICQHHQGQVNQAFAIERQKQCFLCSAYGLKNCNEHKFNVDKRQCQTAQPCESSTITDGIFICNKESNNLW